MPPGFIAFGFIGVGSQDELAIKSPFRLAIVRIQIGEAAGLALIFRQILVDGHHVKLNEAIIVEARALAVGNLPHPAWVPAAALLFFFQLFAMLGLKLGIG